MREGGIVKNRMLSMSDEVNEAGLDGSDGVYAIISVPWRITNASNKE